MIKQLLQEIENAGFKAYVVGGYVRDFYMHIPCFDIDIATSAKIEDLKQIFKDFSYQIHYHCLSFEIDRYKVQISPYRKEGKYIQNRYPKKIKYTKSLFEDSKRRDFTINSIYMDQNEKYISFHNGLKDLEQKKIRMIGNPDVRLKEDALRILRAIRFAVTLHFDIEENLSQKIGKYAYLIDTLSYQRKKEELDKMFEKDVSYAFSLINKYKLNASLAVPYDLIITHYIPFIWMQMEYSLYPLSREELKKIKRLEFLKDTPLKEETLFYATLEEVEAICKLKGFDFSKYKQKWENLPIHHTKQIQLDIEFLVKNKYPIKEIKKDIQQQILLGNLPNEKKKIMDYIKENYNN